MWLNGAKVLVQGEVFTCGKFVVQNMRLFAEYILMTTCCTLYPQLSFYSHASQLCKKKLFVFHTFA